METQPLSAARLRADFDRSFAEAPAERAERPRALLAVAIHGEPYALDLAEIAGLVSDRHILPSPGRAPGFLGLASQRGSLWPVWDLGQLLGYGGAGRQARWMIMASGEPRWAAVFERFDGYLSARQEELSPYAGESRAASFAREACTMGGMLRPVLRLSSMLELIKGRIG